MEFNADFTKRVLVRSADLPWRDSPAAGVKRRMLDRIGGEVARATSIVRYAAGSRFEPHAHEGGEEFLVLEGVFQDEAGDYAAGTYVRNPPGSRHAPRSDEGCVIFVKLRQFDPQDRIFVRQRISLAFDRTAPRHEALFERSDEQVSVETIPAGNRLELDAPLGAELLVLAGEIEEAGETLRKLDWLRLPAPAALNAAAGAQGAKIWLKLGGRRSTTPEEGA